MRRNRLVLGIKGMSDDKLEAKTLFIISSLTGNAHFPSLTPDLPALVAASTRYSEALAGAKTRDAVKIIEKNDSRKALEEILRSIADFVTMASNGQRAMLASSGFSVSAVSNSPKTLGSVSNFTVKVGETAGEAILSLDAVEGAKSYTFFFVPLANADGPWFHVLSSGPYCKIPGMLSVTEYAFKVGITGSKGQITYSEIIRKTVL